MVICRHEQIIMGMKPCKGNKQTACGIVYKCLTSLDTRSEVVHLQVRNVKHRHRNVRRALCEGIPVTFCDYLLPPSGDLSAVFRPAHVPEVVRTSCSVWLCNHIRKTLSGHRCGWPRPNNPRPVAEMQKRTMESLQCLGDRAIATCHSGPVAV